MQPGATTKDKTHSNNLQEFLTKEAHKCATGSCFESEGGCKTLAGGGTGERPPQKHCESGPVKELREYSWG